jgi:hypothetical protein
VTPEADSPESTETPASQLADSDPRPPTAASTEGGTYPPSPAAGTASPQERLAAIANERPEAAAGAAFAGGLLLALILKRLAR